MLDKGKSRERGYVQEKALGILEEAATLSGGEGESQPCAVG
jgi:hypothetical protein